MRLRFTLVGAALVVAAALPAITSGEVVHLRDGSTLLGRLVRVEGDSLTIRLAIGVPVVIPRNQVASITFEDSIPPVPAPASGAPPVVPEGTGTIAVTFGSSSLSSKISIDKKKQWDEHVRSNHIVVEFFVDGNLAYSRIDSTMDKTIYKGHITQLKNEIELEDFTVDAPAGVRQCEVVIRNSDPETFRADFDPAPLELTMPLDNLQVNPGMTSAVALRIDRGFLRMGKPKIGAEK